MSIQDQQTTQLSDTEKTSSSAEEQLRIVRANLEMTFKNVPSGIYLYDNKGRILLANALGARLLGFKSVEELLQTRNLAQMRQRFYEHYQVVDEDGNAFPPERGPVGIALQEQRENILICHYFNKKSLDHFWALCRATPVFDEQGNLSNVIYSITDITLQKELDKRKDDFISMASHELNTPITSLKGFTQVLQRRFRQRDDETSLQILNRIDYQIDKLTRLIKELLDISRMQTGRLEYTMQPFDVHELAQEIVEIVQLTTVSHGLILENTVPVRVLGDKDRLGQVFMNLLTNAIKYSPQADKVILRVVKDGENVVVSVQDFGIGIAEVYQDKIFERFYQVSESAGKAYPGLGIGLYLVSEIIKRHQGRVWVESGKGGGSTFSFSLPFLRE